MYFVTMDKTTCVLDIVRNPTTRYIAQFEDQKSAMTFAAQAAPRIAEFRREVADARHHLDRQFAVLAAQIKSKEG